MAVGILPLSRLLTKLSERKKLLFHLFCYGGAYWNIKAHPFQGLAGPGRDEAKIRKLHRFRRWRCTLDISSTQPASRHRCALSKKSCVQLEQNCLCPSRDPICLGGQRVTKTLKGMALKAISARDARTLMRASLVASARRSIQWFRRETNSQT